MTLDEHTRASQARMEGILGELADRYPAVLERVGVGSGRIGDPFLAAVLDAVARITGEVEHRGERLAPRLFERLREYGRGGPELPLAPATVFEFKLRDGQPSQHLPAGSSLHPELGRVTAGDECPFRTTAAVTVRPWRIEGLKYVTAEIGGVPFDPLRRAALRLTLRPTTSTVRKLPGRLRVYIAADDDLSHRLLQAMFADGCGAFASLNGKDWKPIRVRPVGFGPNSRLFPGGGLHSAALVREAIAFPRKHYFIDLLGIAFPPTTKPELTIAFTFNAAVPALASLNAGDLKLNCVPAVNLFPASPDGIRLEAGRTEYPVTLGRLADRAELYSVDAVTEVGRNEAKNEAIRRECPRQYSSRCDASVSPGAHEWHPTRSGHEDGTVLSVIRTRPRAEEVLTRLELSATCTNGDRAGRLAAGTRFILDANSETCSAEMLHRPTALVKPPVNADAADALFDDVGVARWSLLGRDAAHTLRTRLRALACPCWVTASGLAPSWAAAAGTAIDGLIDMAARGSGEYRLAFEPGHYPGQAPWLFASAVGEYLRRGTGMGTPPRVVSDLSGTRRERA